MCNVFDLSMEESVDFDRRPVDVLSGQIWALTFLICHLADSSSLEPLIEEHEIETPYIFRSTERARAFQLGVKQIMKQLSHH